MDFTGKVICITGGGSGIGADAAINLAKLGASVALVDRNAGRLNEVAEKIRSSGSLEPLAIVADVTTDTDQIINATIQQFGKLDVLINNAGVLRFNNDEPLGSLDTFDEIFNTNVRSVLALTKLAVPHLEQTKGNVINISSVTGTIASDTHTAYSLSKAAVDHLTRCAAIELAPKGIRVNAIKSGLIRTSIFEAAGLRAQQIDGIYEYGRQKYPAGRVGVAEDITRAIAFLANGAARFITGHLMIVDGGEHLVE